MEIFSEVRILAHEFTAVRPHPTRNRVIKIKLTDAIFGGERSQFNSGTLSDSISLGPINRGEGISTTFFR
jgi:hypothetical protein